MTQAGTIDNVVNSEATVRARFPVGTIVRIVATDSHHYDQVGCVVGYIPLLAIINGRAIDDGTRDLKVSFAWPGDGWSGFGPDEVGFYNEPEEAR